MKPVVLALLSSLAVLPAGAGGVLTDPQVRDPLVIARAADVLRRSCPEYNANMIAALRELRAHERLARSRGMSTEEIRTALRKGPARSDIYSRADVLIKALPGDACQKADMLVSRHPLAARLISK